MLAPHPETSRSSADSESASVRRGLVFVLLGPVLSIIVVFWLLPIVTGVPLDLYGIPPVFFPSLIIGAITGPADGVLAKLAPIWLRAPLIAIVGSTVVIGLAFGLIFYISSHTGRPMVIPKPHELIPMVLFGALNAGACSLLAGLFCRNKI
jgi:hypothetical protein